MFDSFWKDYPKKEGKKPAFKAFASALSRATFEDIMAGVARYKASDKVERGYVMLAQRWLNEDHWEDLLPPAPGTEAAKKAEQRRASERESSRQYLEFLKSQQVASVAPPKCEHGATVALCRTCLKQVG
jgi:hypothetical protein